MDVDGVLLDVDGVLTVSWRELPGAAEAVAALRSRGVPFLLATNTTTMSRSVLAATLARAGIEVTAGDLVTAPVAAARFLRSEHPGASVFQVGGRDAREDLDGVRFVEDGSADVVLVAGADDDFTWARLDQAFRLLLDGAAFVAMHRNTSWTTDRGPTLDSGPFVAALEAATGAVATVTGKPAPAFFSSCVSMLGLEPSRVAMVGDDLESDVLAAQRCGLTGVLVRTGKFRQGTLDAATERPDLVLDSVAVLPAALE
ncbi:MAG TPA: HAD-IIA family hydrolase [Actinomycetota bacterium]